MSGTFPTDLIPSSAELVSATNTRVSIPHSGKRTARSGDTQRFQLSMNMPAMERADYARLYAFLMSQRGAYDVFQVQVPPPFDTPRGTWATASSVKLDGASQSGRSLSLKDFTPSQSNVARAMDLFTIAGDQKVYTVIDDANSDGSGLVTLTIEPALEITTLADGAVLTTSDVQLTMAAESDSLKLALDTALHGRFKLEFLEDPN